MLGRIINRIRTIGRARIIIVKDGSDLHFTDRYTGYDSTGGVHNLHERRAANNRRNEQTEHDTLRSGAGYVPSPTRGKRNGR